MSRRGSHNSLRVREKYAMKSYRAEFQKEEATQKNSCRDFTGTYVVFAQYYRLLLCSVNLKNYR